jgi:suppressor of fused protein SUFU
VDDAEHSAGGSRIYRHGEPREPTPGEQPRDWEAIEAHVERHFGPIEMVYHELASEYVHLDVLQVPAHAGRPFHMLVTCGMSARPMTVPVGAEARHAELVMGLPADWPLDEAAWRDERHYWPVRTLKQLARLPHAYGTFLAPGHTIPNGDPPAPYSADTELCCSLIAPPVTLPAGAEVLDLEDGPVHFYAVVPLHRDEMELKLTSGMDALLDRLDAAQVTEVLNATRPSWGHPAGLRRAHPRPPQAGQRHGGHGAQQLGEDRRRR